LRFFLGLVAGSWDDSMVTFLGKSGVTRHDLSVVLFVEIVVASSGSRSVLIVLVLPLSVISGWSPSRLSSKLSSMSSSVDMETVEATWW